MPYQTNITPIPAKAIPRLTIKLNGVVQPLVMEHLVIHIKRSGACIVDRLSSEPVELREGNGAAKELEPNRESNSELIPNPHKTVPTEAESVEVNARSHVQGEMAPENLPEQESERSTTTISRIRSE